MKNILVLLIFVLLTVVMTYPLVIHATTAIAGPPGDGFIHLYEMFWFKRALFDLHVWPLFNPETFYPIGYNLALSHITPSNVIPMMPVVLLAGPIAGFNGAVVLSFVLSGFGAYLLTVYFTRNRWAGMAAGILFAFSAYRMHNLGAGWLPNLGTQWLPFAILYLDRLLTRRASPWRGGALAGFFFALVCLSSWYHVYIAGVAIAAYLLARGWPWRMRIFSRRVLGGLAVFACVAGLMVLPLALPLVQYGATERGIDWPMLSADDASASVDDLLLPSAYHPLWGDAALDRRERTYAAVVPGLAYLSLPALALGALALRRRVPAARAWLLVGLVGAVLTLGLTLHVNGVRVYIPVPESVEQLFSRGMLTLAGKLALNTGAYTPFRAEGAIPIPMPGMFFWLFMPFGSTMRVFHRFALDSSLAFAVLAGLGMAALWRSPLPPLRRGDKGGLTGHVGNTSPLPPLQRGATGGSAAGMDDVPPLPPLQRGATGGLTEHVGNTSPLPPLQRGATGGSAAGMDDVPPLPPLQRGDKGGLTEHVGNTSPLPPLQRGDKGGYARALATVALIGVIILDVVAAPLSFGYSDARGSELDLWLKQQSGDFSVIHLPLIRSLNGPSLYRAAIHGKKISYGYGTFFPTAWREAVTPLGNFPNPEAIALLRSWNVRYVCIGQGAYEEGLVDATGDTWQKVQERLANTPELRLVRTFDEASPVTGDSLSAKLSKPWNVYPTIADKTHIYELAP